MAGKATGAAAGSTPSGQAIANSVDLLTEILLRLPAKSLIRFKSVSKYWLSFISDSRFATDHSARNPSPIISGLYFYSDGQFDSVSLHGHRNLLPSLSFLDGLDAKYFPTRIQHSCNGLLLFQTRYLDIPDGHRLSTVFIVCNPTTNKYTILPETGFPSRLTCVRGAYLAFDPSKSPHYKVIVASQNYFSFNVEIDVYDSESTNWRNVSQKQETGLGVYWNGAIHWLSYRSTSLLKFDVNADKMIALTLRSKITYSVYNSYFGECGGRLILIPAHSPSSMELPILEYLEESENSRWIVKYRVNLRIVVSSVFPEIKNVFKYCVLGVVERSKMREDYALVLGIRGKIISYNLKSKTMDVLRDLVPGELIRDVDDFAYSFIETLSPV